MLGERTMTHQTANQQFKDADEVPQPDKVPVLNLAKGQAALESAVEQFIYDISPSVKKLIKLKSAKHADAALLEGDPLPNMDARLFLASPGIGKTRSVQSILAALPSGAVVWVFQPTLKKADEFAEEMAHLDLTTSVWRGRGAFIAKQDVTKMCNKHAIASQVAGRGFSVNAAMCERTTGSMVQHCDQFGACSYIRQRQNAKSHARGGLFVMTHASLSSPPPFPAPHLVIIDEDPSFAMIETTKATPRAWNTYAMWRATLMAEEIKREQEAQNRQGASLMASDMSAEVEITGQEIFAAVDEIFDALLNPEPLPRIVDVFECTDMVELIRRLERLKRGFSSAISPEFNQTEIRAALASTSLQDLTALIKILRALSHEIMSVLDQPAAARRQSLNGISVVTESNGALASVTAHSIKPVSFSPITPILVLDGTADEGLLASVLRRPVATTRIELERKGEVVRCHGRSFCNLDLLRSPSGRDLRGLKLGREEMWKGVRGLIAREARKSRTGIFVCSTMSVEQEARARFEDDFEEWNLDWSHYGATRGINKWTARDTVILIGRKQPPVHAVVNAGRAFFASDWQPLVAINQFEPRHKKIFDKQGQSYPIHLPVPLDPRLNRVLWQMREAEVLQALDRVRPVRFARRVILLNALDLRMPHDDARDPQIGVPADICRPWSELRADRNRAEHILETTSGFLPLAPRPLHRMAPSVFKSEAAAKKWLYRTDIIAALAQEADKLVEVAVRMEGQRGRPWPLMVRRSEHPDLTAARATFERGMQCAAALWEAVEDHKEAQAR